MRTITGHGAETTQGREGNLYEANELNLFSTGLTTWLLSTLPPAPPVTLSPLPPPPHLSPLPPPHPLLPSSLPPCSPPSPLRPLLSPGPIITIMAEDMRCELGRLRPGKAAGPDDLSPRVLKVCAAQLCRFFRHIFNLSLSTTIVPVLWKTSCLVPVPKKLAVHPTGLTTADHV